MSNYQENLGLIAFLNQFGYADIYFEREKNLSVTSCASGMCQVFAPSCFLRVLHVSPICFQIYITDNYYIWYKEEHFKCVMV